MKKEENGKQKDLEVYVVSMYKGRKVRRLVSRKGKPLEGSDLAKENERVEKQVRSLERGNIPPLTNRRVNWKISFIAASSRTCDRPKSAVARYG